MTRTMVRIRRPLATVALALSLLIVPGSALAAELESGTPVDGHQKGQICQTSPQINRFEPACSGQTDSQVARYVAPDEPVSQSESSSNDYTVWIASGLLGALAVGIAGLAYLTFHRNARAHA